MKKLIILFLLFSLNLTAQEYPVYDWESSDTIVIFTIDQVRYLNEKLNNAEICEKIQYISDSIEIQNNNIILEHEKKLKLKDLEIQQVNNKFNRADMLVNEYQKINNILIDKNQEIVNVMIKTNKEHKNKIKKKNKTIFTLVVALTGTIGTIIILN